MLDSQFQELASRLQVFYGRSEEDMYTEYAPLEMQVAVTDEPVPWGGRLSLSYRPVGEGESWGRAWQIGWIHLTGRVTES